MSKIVSVIILTSIAFSAIVKAQSGPVKSGPLIGYVDNNEAHVWIDIVAGIKKVQLYYLDNSGKADSIIHWRETRQDSTPVRIRIKELKSSHNYLLSLKLDDKAVEITHPVTFKTAPDSATGADFSFLLGSCLYINDPSEKSQFGQDPGILESMASMPTEFMLWAGDNVYLREGDFKSKERIISRYYKTRRTPELQHLIGSRANFATWDDHDFGPNDCDRTFPLAKTSLETFQNFWAQKKYGEEDNPGVYQKFTWNDCDFFLLDDRTYRSSLLEPGVIDEKLNKNKKYLGDRQFEWLKEKLKSSNATFKIIVSGGQMLNPLAQKECFRYYNYEYNELLTFILENKIEGIVFISGDRHFSELLATEPKGGYPLFEFTCSALTSRPRDLNKSNEMNNPYRVENTLVTQNNFGKVTVTGPSGSRRMILETYDNKGKRIWEFIIQEKELKFKTTKDG